MKNRKTSQNPYTIYAVFIGINGYPRNQLSGCINDVVDMKKFFEELSDANNLAFKPKFLLAPNKENSIDPLTLIDAKLKESDYDLPTRKNILDSFQHFESAKEGDICLFYYSGHGSKQEAPREFLHLKSEPQIETIIAVDSRPNGRDIIDKELGYQVWATLHPNKGIHFLAIMDCCHAGDNMRDGEGIKNKEDRPNNNITPLSDYFGFQEGGNEFYRFDESRTKIDVAVPNYVHLAASRENESAKELYLDNKQRGIFTHNLLRVLKNGGLYTSYNELIEQVKILVTNKVKNQIPNVHAFGTAKSENIFLKNKYLNIPPWNYNISYNKDKKKWILYAGEIHGISPSLNEEKSLVKVVDKNNNFITTGEICYANTTTSELELEKDTSYYSEQILKGIIQSIASAKMKIAIEDHCAHKEELKKLISSSLFIVFEKEIKKAAYIIRQQEKGLKYILTTKGEDYSLFKGQTKIKSFVYKVEQVAKWMSLLKRKNTNTTIKKEDIEVEVSIIEGKKINASNIDSIEAIKTIKNPSEINLHYKFVDNKLLQPAIRVRLRCLKSDYFIGVLYMSSKFGISQKLQTKELKRNGDWEILKYQHTRAHSIYELSTIPIAFDPLYHRDEIIEITDYIRIIISTKDFDLTKYIQQSIPLDDSKRIQYSDFEGVNTRGAVKRKNLEDWTAINIPIKIRRDCYNDCACRKTH